MCRISRVRGVFPAHALVSYQADGLVTAVDDGVGVDDKSALLLRLYAHKGVHITCYGVPRTGRCVGRCREAVYLSVVRNQSAVVSQLKEVASFVEAIAQTLGVIGAHHELV